jgi:hypothetical protein
MFLEFNDVLVRGEKQELFKRAAEELHTVKGPTEVTGPPVSIHRRRGLR